MDTPLLPPPHPPPPHPIHPQTHTHTHTLKHTHTRTHAHTQELCLSNVSLSISLNFSLSQSSFKRYGSCRVDGVLYVICLKYTCYVLTWLSQLTGYSNREVTKPARFALRLQKFRLPVRGRFRCKSLVTFHTKSCYERNRYGK